MIIYRLRVIEIIFSLFYNVKGEKNMWKKLLDLVKLCFL